MSKLWVYLITGLCAACALAGCQGGAPAQSQSQRAQTIETAAVSFQTISPELMIPASVQPDPERVVHVFAPVSGRLVSLKVRVGDRVRAAQAVAVLQSSDAAQARSDFEKARAQAERSQSALRRASLLYDHHAIPPRIWKMRKPSLHRTRANSIVPANACRCWDSVRARLQIKST